MGYVALITHLYSLATIVSASITYLGTTQTIAADTDQLCQSKQRRGLTLLRDNSSWQRHSSPTLATH